MPSDNVTLRTGDIVLHGPSGEKQPEPTAPEPKWECTVRDGRFVEPCDGLASLIQGNAAFSKAKGIRFWEYRNTKEMTRWFVGATSDRHPNGLCFSYCPICGENISAPFDREADQEPSHAE